MGVGVHQPQGCGRPGDYITLSRRLLEHLHSQGNPQQHLDQLGKNIHNFLCSFNKIEIYCFVL